MQYFRLLSLHPTPRTTSYYRSLSITIDTRYSMASFLGTLFTFSWNEALIQPIRVLPSGCAMLNPFICTYSVIHAGHAPILCMYFYAICHGTSLHHAKITCKTSSSPHHLLLNCDCQKHTHAQPSVVTQVLLARSAVRSVKNILKQSTAW